jgi:hypothetical protein
MKTKLEKFTADEIRKALDTRFTQPEWALFFEVGNGTGYTCNRHADAIAMNMYPSRGLSIVGFEIKVSRADLKKELDSPNKAESIAQFCNEWYLAVPEGLIHDEDIIPAGWGIMECKKDQTIRVKKRPLFRTDVIPVTKEFTAALLRSSNKRDNEEIGKIRHEAYEEYAKGRDKYAQHLLEIETDRLKKRLEYFERFEKATGESFRGWVDIDNLAERWKMAKEMQSLYGRAGQLKMLVRKAEQFIESVNLICGDNVEIGVNSNDER